MQAGRLAPISAFTMGEGLGGVHWRACRAVVACWMADVIDSACATCAAAAVLGTSHEPHGQLTPLLHIPHGPLAIVTEKFKFVSEFKIPNLPGTV